ncbi:MAG TPA: effector-associated domain EAD1-containing protein [Pyrinomonadaceae bacterium]|nr:effector-associated domain EAD1-containing protein [Pyrinomonadaceae bacterium]
MPIDLKGKQLQALRDALVSAFPSYADLKMMTLFQLNEKLQNHVEPGPMNRVAMDLIDWAEAQGKLEALIAGARAKNPGNVALQRFAVEVSLTSDAPPQGRLEAIVLEGVPFQQVNQWRARMVERERTVCRVEMPEGKGVGTGFLLTKDAVLTNWHVADVLALKNLQPEQAGVRFDYAAGIDGITVPAGQFYPFKADWLIDSSPVRDLDFALVRVAGDPGMQTVGETGATRGWLDYKQHQFAIGEIQLILQHPLAAPLNLSAGAVTAVNSMHKRVTYTANTERGSSGSPVFTLGWDLVALHHYGEQTGNLGIPLNYIWQQLEQGNKL